MTDLEDDTPQPTPETIGGCGHVPRPRVCLSCAESMSPLAAEPHTIEVVDLNQEAERVLARFGSLALSDQAEVLSIAQALVRERARERLRLIDAESKQLAFVLGSGPRQRKTDRGAEEDSLVAYLNTVDYLGPMPLQSIAEATKLGARTLPTLERLKEKNTVRAIGRGRDAAWQLVRSDRSVTPSTPAPAARKPRAPRAPKPPPAAASEVLPGAAVAGATP